MKHIFRQSEKHVELPNCFGRLDLLAESRQIILQHLLSAQYEVRISLVNNVPDCPLSSDIGFGLVQDCGGVHSRVQLRPFESHSDQGQGSHGCREDRGLHARQETCT